MQDCVKGNASIFLCKPEAFLLLMRPRLQIILHASKGGSNSRIIQISFIEKKKNKSRPKIETPGQRISEKIETAMRDTKI